MRKFRVIQRENHRRAQTVYPTIKCLIKQNLIILIKQIECLYHVFPVRVEPNQAFIWNVVLY